MESDLYQNSSSLATSKGVSEGSILGPILFILFINNILLQSLHCNVHYYADDVTLYSFGSTPAQASANLQTAFNVFQQCLISHKLCHKLKWSSLINTWAFG